MKDNLKLMLLTSDVEYALEGQAAGVDRIFFDLEYIGKAERQRGRNTLLSYNNIEDVSKLRKVLHSSELLVRVNPINPNSIDEINKVIEYGADIVMLPMIIDAEDVRHFIKMVDGRAKTCLLLETAQALARFDEILEVDGVDEVFIGLNDMHISMDLTFMFELLAGGIVEYMADKCKKRGIPFGFGGIAKIGEGFLRADLIIGEHYRIGSNCVILSRTFRNEVGANLNEKIILNDEIKKVRERENEVKMWTDEESEQNRKNVVRLTRELVMKLQSK